MGEETGGGERVRSSRTRRRDEIDKLGALAPHLSSHPSDQSLLISGVGRAVAREGTERNWTDIKGKPYGYDWRMEENRCAPQVSALSPQTNAI